MSKINRDIEDKRVILFPIVHHDIWKIVCDSRDQMWTVDEIHFNKDIEDWKNVINGEKIIIEHILGFFAIADNLVIDNIMDNFKKEFPVREIEAWFNLQSYQETIHAETYAKTIHEYFGSKSVKLLAKHMSLDIIKEKNDWVIKWMDAKKYSLAQRVAAFVFIEGIAFSSLFKLIDVLCKDGKFPGLRQSNELISRDESQHMIMGIHLLLNYMKKEDIDEKIILDIWKTGIKLEEKFIISAIPKSVGLLTQEKMINYVKYVADVVLVQMNIKPIYKVNNPFKEMKILGMVLEEKQFEIIPTNYTVGKSDMIGKKDDYDDLLDEF